MTRLLKACAVLMVVAVTGSVSCSRRSAPAFDSDEDHFLFGSIGAEERTGVPYWIWLVLPRIFPEHLPAPGGYAALGIAWKEGYEMPVGFTKVTGGYPRVGINCAMCHTAVEMRPSAPPKVTAIKMGPRGSDRQGPAQRYLAFLFACASDPRFTSSTILAEIAKQHELSLFERWRYRFVVIPQTRQRLLDLGKIDGLLNGTVNWVDHDFAAWSTDVAGLKRAESYLK
jgi:hypothetical protein